MNPSSSNLEQPLKRPIQRRPWTPLEDATLKKLIQSHGTNWKIIQQEMVSRTISQCQQRWKSLKPASEKKKRWTAEEDQQLCDLYKQYGNKWAVIGAHMKGRTDQQLRIRYVNILDPNVKNNKWTSEEDQQLYQLFIQYGTLWSIICKQFENRSSNNIKNRFYTHTCKEYFSMPQPYQNNQSFSDWSSVLLEKRQNILKSMIQQENEINGYILDSCKQVDHCCEWSDEKSTQSNQSFMNDQCFQNNKLNTLMECENSCETQDFMRIQHFESEIDQYFNLQNCDEFNSKYIVNEYEL